jgi:hypothetical protein
LEFELGAEFAEAVPGDPDAEFAVGVRLPSVFRGVGLRLVETGNDFVVRRRGAEEIRNERRRGRGAHKGTTIQRRRHIFPFDAKIFAKRANVKIKRTLFQAPKSIVTDAKTKIKRFFRRLAKFRDFFAASTPRSFSPIY